MGNCRICGVWIQEVSSSAINDLCSELSCWKQAHPELFESETTIPHELHEQLRRELKGRTLKQKRVDLFTFWRLNDAS